jgi:hypothetical protein
MTKYYKSHSCISLNVKLPSGESLHISFSPKSHNKGSVYSTDNKDIQQGLENNYYFKKSFFLDHVEEKKAEVAPKPKAEEKKTENVVQVSDLGTAKEYLAEKFGVSRTTMRSTAAVLAQAKLHNVKFVGLEE